ncbi:hypothetical protein VTG60DRAFT_882 [Thermothelomyces hinnuleus]
MGVDVVPQVTTPRSPFAGLGWSARGPGSEGAAFASGGAYHLLKLSPLFKGIEITTSYYSLSLVFIIA